MLSQPSSNRLQVKRTVGNMQQQEPSRREMPAVNVSALRGEQMHRDVVARKSIYRDGVEVLRVFAFQLNSRVSQHNVRRCLRVLEIEEQSLGYRFDARIDFIEADGVAGTAQCRERARSQSDHRDFPRRGGQSIQSDRDSAV